MQCVYRLATPDDAEECVAVRGKTRENSISAARLAAIGITAESWGNDIQSGNLPGYVCLSEGRIIGYCFGEANTGEVVVLALLPEAESQGIGKALLSRVVSALRAKGLNRLFLGCSADPAVRSYGFWAPLKIH